MCLILSEKIQWFDLFLDIFGTRTYFLKEPCVLKKMLFKNKTCFQIKNAWVVVILKYILKSKFGVNLM